LNLRNLGRLSIRFYQRLAIDTAEIEEEGSNSRNECGDNTGG